METQLLIIQPEYLSQLWSRIKAETKVCEKQIFSKNHFCALFNFFKNILGKTIFKPIYFIFYKPLPTQSV